MTQAFGQRCLHSVIQEHEEFRYTVPHLQAARLVLGVDVVQPLVVLRRVVALVVKARHIGDDDQLPRIAAERHVRAVDVCCALQATGNPGAVGMATRTAGMRLQLPARDCEWDASLQLLDIEFRSIELAPVLQSTHPQIGLSARALTSAKSRGPRAGDQYRRRCKRASSCPGCFRVQRWKQRRALTRAHRPWRPALAAGAASAASALSSCL